MPVNEHPHVSIDEDLIGYTDWWLDASARRGHPIAGWITLIKRLRAALAARPQPLFVFEGTFDALAANYGWQAHDNRFRWEVYAAVAGSADPRWYAVDETGRGVVRDHDEAVAGSATPTGDD